METQDNSFHAKRYIDITNSYKSEKWCDDCWLMKHLCICSKLHSINTPLNVNFQLFIHYKEYKRTSNTGILLKKLFPQSGVYISGIEEDRIKLLQRLENSKNTCVLYPGEKSIALSDWLLTCQEGEEKNFILLDST